jgi:hypothetical protein
LVFYGFFLWFNMLLMSFNTDWGKIQKVRWYSWLVRHFVVARAFSLTLCNP